MTEARHSDWDELLKKAKEGNREALDELCRKIGARLEVVAQYKLRGWAKEEVADVIHDSLLTFCEKLDKIYSNPHLYALKIMQNKIGDALRARRTSREVSLEPFAAQDPVQDKVPGGQVHSALEVGEDFTRDIEAKDLADHVRRAIKKLPEFCQTYFMGVLEGRCLAEMWQFFRDLDPALKRATFDSKVLRCRRRLWELVRPFAQYER